MGQQGKRLRQLARGTLPHFFQPVESSFILEEKMELDSPVEILDSLLFVARVMLEQLILRATSCVLALASVTITLSLDGNRSHVRTVRPARAREGDTESDSLTTGRGNRRLDWDTADGGHELGNVVSPCGPTRARTKCAARRRCFDYHSRLF